MGRARTWKLVATGAALASLGGAGLAAFAGGAASSASSLDRHGAPTHDAPGVGPGGTGAPGQLGVATLVLTASPGSGTTTSAGATTTLELSSYDFAQAESLNVGSSSSGAGAGKVTFSPLVVTTSPGVQTPGLFADLATGSHFSKAELVVRGPRGITKLDAVFSLVALHQIEESSTGGPTETLSFEYGAVTITPPATTSPTSSS